MDTREKCTRLVARHYKDVPLRDRTFNDGIRRFLKEGAKVLDAGCGCDAPTSSIHAKKTGLCVGVDQVDRFESVPGVEQVRGDLSTLPFVDGSFDLIYSRSVLEHLKEPSQVLGEFSRVLKKGGAAILITPNKYDYASILARLVPHRLHGRVIRASAGDDAYDDFPTFFRCNTRRAVTRALESTDLKVSRIDFVRHYPYYLMFSLPLFYLGMAYDRIITRLRLDWLQPTLYMELIKG